MNTIIIDGNLTRDAKCLDENRYVFTLAVNNIIKGSDDAEFISCFVWAGEKLATYLVKGAHVAVSGSLTIDFYDDDYEDVHSKDLIINVDRLNLLHVPKNDENAQKVEKSDEKGAGRKVYRKG